MADLSSLEKIESFPYRHRVSEVMASPLATASPDTPVAEASRRMADAGISSLVAVDAAGRPAGIVTERDILRAVADHRPEIFDLPLAAIMSRPVATVRHDALVYIAMGRMDRLRLRHLVAVDEEGRAVGMVTVRGLLHLRAGAALAIGDEITAAADGGAMRAAKAMLPRLAASLLEEGVDGLGVAAVTSSALRDMTMRAAELAETGMAGEWGPPPVPWCVLLLGSGGRRESLFGPDQDNAIIHDGDAAHDAWFAEAGRRINETLDRAGVPLCQGGVMARNSAWRRGIADWKGEIERWMREADGPELLNVDIFLDFRPVYGERSLAKRVRDHLTEAAAASSRFLLAMAQSGAELKTPLGVLGQFKTREGRINIKLSGTMPLVNTVRLLAVKHRITATGTAERLGALAAGGHMSRHEAAGLVAGLELMLRALIRQQIADLEAGRSPSNDIDPKRLPPPERDRLKATFRAIDSLNWVLRNALSTV